MRSPLALTFKAPLTAAIFYAPLLDCTLGERRGDQGGRDRHLDQSQDAEAGGRAHERDGQEEREPSVLEKVATPAAKMPLAPPPLAPAQLDGRSALASGRGPRPRCPARLGTLGLQAFDAMGGLNAHLRDRSQTSAPRRAQSRA
jgi:hypothetical protein